MLGRRTRFGLDPESASMALTFDDGPDPVFTPAVLDTLDRLAVRATFFVLGAHATAHPAMVAQLLEAGHAVGCHSWFHPDPWTLGRAALFREYRRGKRAAEAAAGRRINLFRPPKGYQDRRTAAVTRLLDLHPWVWSCDPGDYQPGARTADLVDTVLASGSGAVVLLHDGMPRLDGIDPRSFDRSATVAAIEPIVLGCRERGLRFVTLDEV